MDAVTSTIQCQIAKRTTAVLLMCGTSVVGLSSNAFSQETDDDIELTEIVVIGDPVGLLEDRPTESVFGFGRSILETPRSISVISDVTMERYAIEDIDDFIATTPGTFGGSFFGVPGAISVRGSLADNYFRGFKRVYIESSFPNPIGSASRVEVVRGAVPVIYGAGTVGGLLNFVPNAAKGEGRTVADGPSGSIAYTGGSFNRNNVTAEAILPFEIGEREAGLALYGEYEDSGSFYRGREPQHELIQADFNTDLGDGWSVQLGGMYFNSEGYFGTPGWNRLTQDLIDNGTYITGIDTDITDVNGDGQLNPAEIDAVVGTFFGSSNIRTLIDFGVFGFPDAYALDTGLGTTELGRRQVFISDQEIADAETVTLYADIVKDLDDGQFKLQFFHDSADSVAHVTYGFANEKFIDVYEIRASLNKEIEISDNTKVDLNVTASHRNHDIELREHFLSGYLVLDRRDISAGATPGDILATPLTDPSIAWDSDFDGSWSDTGIGLVADIQFDRFSLLVGGRYDYYDAEATDAGATTFGAPREGEATEGDFSYSASLSYRSEAGFVPYVTYAEGSEPLYDAAGGISPSAAASGQFLFGSELFEAGVKFSVLDERLNGSIAYYEQSRSLIDTFGNVDRELSDGIEAELRYLVNDNFTLTGAATFQNYRIAAPGTCGSGNGSYVVIAPTHPTVNAFGTTITSEQGYGGLFAALNSSCLPELQDGYDRNIIPERVFSAFATYTSDDNPDGFNWGATLGGTYVSETGGKTVTAVTLPDYVSVRAALFASYKSLSITATLDNAFDARYFQPLASVYEEVAALPGQGRTARIIARISF